MVCLTRNGAKLCERRRCARGMPRAQPRPKTSAPTTPSQSRPVEKGQNGKWAIAFLEGWGEVGPPDSEWGQTLRAASVCPRDAPASAAPKNDLPKAPVPKPPAENGPNEGCAIALVGGCGEVGPPDSEWGQTLREASVCPRDAPGTAAPQNGRPKAPVPKRPAEKGPNEGCAIALVGGWGEVGPPDSEWGQTL